MNWNSFNHLTFSAPLGQVTSFSIIAAYRFSVSWVLRLRAFAFFIAVSSDVVIHIGKFRKGTNNLVHIFLIIIKARLQGYIYGLRYKLNPLAEFKLIDMSKSCS